MPLRISQKLNERLDRLVKATGRSKSYYLQRAIEEFLEEQEDYAIAVERAKDRLSSIPLAEVVKRLGLSRKDLTSRKWRIEET